jgi:hypothetical protein
VTSTDTADARRDSVLSPPPGRLARSQPHFDPDSARELLARTAELPDTKRELLHVLSEYRAALWTFAFPSAASRDAD